ncbi:hypothetical protein CANTEDRAFT_112362 [Yamadazyma tenuis ATCC 10573]|nr:uncharacterized protein CANTEDRAFT_112362 [Yamadazyma tenuis ATCC 10573]EGV66857.1 hypothetical protein CANTEDRAFT_112362 [Yamadazyma tenuis ATCC 10573]
MDNVEVSFNGKIDILILKQWPSKLSNLIKKDTVSIDFTIDNLITRFRPRYIFASGEFHEYGPFRWESGAVSRFVSLSKEGEGKWFYGFNFPLVPTEVASQDLMDNPFIETLSVKRRVDQGENSESLPKRAKVSPQNCFFCLSNPNVETHMIITIGQLVYMTVAKGPLTRSNASMPFSGHGIITPVDHMSKNTKEVDAEMNEFEVKLFHKFKQNYPDFVLVVFDLNLEKNVHYHRQFLPIHNKFLEEDKFSKVLEEKAQTNNEKYNKNHKLEFKNVDAVDVDSQYISFKVYKDEVPVVYQSTIEDDSKIIDLQFPRRVLSYIIRSPKRLYWDKCQQPKFKETQDCEEFKKFFT